MRRRCALALSLLSTLAGLVPASARAAGRVTVARPQPARLTVLVILDRSGSMTGNKLRTTQQACQGVIRRLRARDRAGVIAFDTRPAQVLAVQLVGRGKVAIAAIGRIIAQGGTAFLPALQLGERMLVPPPGLRRGRQHILFLSDGQAPRAGVLAQIRRLRKLGVTLTTVAISPHADRKLLSRMAREGGGRTLYVPHISTLQRALLKELKHLGR